MQTLPESCEHCGRKAFRTPTNRCMYCGKPLHESLKLSEDEMQAFRRGGGQPDAAATEFAAGMRVQQPELAPRRKPGKPSLVRRMGAWLLRLLTPG
jgi:ribosomal protein L37E